MRYLEQITILEDYRNLKKDTVIEAKTVNLLVGNQGTGKSTLLNLIYNKDSKLKLELSSYTIENDADLFFFDSEKQNPRILNPNEFTNADGTDKGIGFKNAITTHFKSHGEILKRYTVDALRKASNCIVFLDEPESGLSIRNQYNLIKSLDTALSNNCQIFISTHCIPLIESIEQVYSMEHNKWMSSKDFIDSQKN